MRTQLKITNNPEQYRERVNEIIESLRNDATCGRDEENGIHCYCMNCRLGAGNFTTKTESQLFKNRPLPTEQETDSFLLYYETGSLKGQYWFFQDKMIFEGFRNSFLDGTEFFYPEEFCQFGEWKVVESSQMWRGPFKEIEGE